MGGLYDCNVQVSTCNVLPIGHFESGSWSRTSNSLRRDIMCSRNDGKLSGGVANDHVTDVTLPITAVVK